jgi:hypothetical protein
MNDLILELTQRVKVLMTNREKLIASRPKWSEIAAGKKKRSEVTTNNCTCSMSTNDTKRIKSEVPTVPITKNRVRLGNQVQMVNPDNLKTVKHQYKPKNKVVVIGDSHAGGCAIKLQEKLKGQYEVLGYVKWLWFLSQRKYQLSCQTKGFPTSANFELELSRLCCGRQKAETMSCIILSCLFVIFPQL